MTLHLYRVNYWLVSTNDTTLLERGRWMSITFFFQVLMTLVGMALFYYAPKLCRNVIFHYSTGVGAGIIFSLLILTYFVQKRVRANKELLEISFL